MAELGLQNPKYRFSVILDRIRKVKEKLGKKNKEKECLRGQCHSAKKTVPVSPYSTLSSWLDDLERIHNPSAEDILHLSPVRRRRMPNHGSHTTSTPVSVVIQPMNRIDRRNKEQDMVGSRSRH